MKLIAFPIPTPSVRAWIVLVGRLALAATLVAALRAGDQAQWGERGTRNQTSSETGLPESADPATGLNVRWRVDLGTDSYATPVIAAGRVYIGTNNGRPRNPARPDDRGVLMCFSERNGEFLWQLATPKLGGDIYLDWPNSGMSSPATVEDGRVYVVSNRGQVMCLDPDGMTDGNDGPCRDEAALFAGPDGAVTAAGPLDADVLWVTDLREAIGIWPHDAAHSSILVDGPFLYLNTGNGVDNTHRLVRRPDAPSLVVLNKESGALVAQDGAKIGPRLVHCQWSSPALGEVGGRRLVVMGGGDGVVYAFEALRDPPAAGTVAVLKTAWWFDCDPAAPRENPCTWNGNRKEGPSNILSMPVFLDGRVYVTGGGDTWWGKSEAWVKCLDAGGAGEVTATALRWSAPLLKHCMSTVAIRDGVLFVADLGHALHALDVKTGQELWSQELPGEVWNGALAADGRVYVADRKGTLTVLAAAREKRLLSQVQLDGPISAAPVAANGSLFIATSTSLYAFGK
jgi:outer membrane protein assembly factor BamB